MTPAALAEKITATPYTGRRRLVAIVGPPASGKSTLAHTLAASDPSFAALPMDGYHLSNDLLDARGLRARKGSPETFDAVGFVHLVKRLRDDAHLFYPTFDRALDTSINASAEIAAQTQTVIVEGNYLLLNRPVWRELSAYWDLSILLDVPENSLTRRLIDRWTEYGMNREDAKKRALSNDIPNALTVKRESLPADLTIAEV